MWFFSFKKVSPLEKKLGYCFKNKNHINKALSHPSLYKREDRAVFSNQRLEFLGDSILGACVSDYLYSNYKNVEEGFLSKKKSQIVSSESLAFLGQKLDLIDFIQVKDSKLLKEDSSRKKIIVDCFEALLGAIYLDSGYQVAYKMVCNWVLSYIDEVLDLDTVVDYKSQFLEWVDIHLKITAEYRSLGIMGPEHCKVFKIGVWLGNDKLGEGTGSSKKKAEQQASQKALKKCVNYLNII